MTQMTIKELDRVVVTQDFAGKAFRKGDVGVVVSGPSAAGYAEVEFFSLTGDSVAVSTIPASALRAAAKGDVMSAREKRYSPRVVFIGSLRTQSPSANGTATDSEPRATFAARRPGINVLSPGGEAVYAE